jgi:DNA-binding transcriptional MerR regulator
MTADSDKKLLIGHLAKLAGVKADTIRFYERIGLLPKPERKESGYRVYDQAALRRVRFIKQAQSLGFSLDEVQRILNLRGSGRTTCQCVIAMAEATLSETEEKLRELQRFARALKDNLGRWQKMSGKGRRVAGEFCELIESSAMRGTDSAQ